MAFTATARTDGSVAVLELNGELEGTADDALSGAYTEATSSDAPTVLLNFKGVSYINSTGIAHIVGLLAKARSSGRTVMACGLTEHYQEIFEITRITDFMTIYADESEAIGSTAP